MRSEIRLAHQWSRLIDCKSINSLHLDPSLAPTTNEIYIFVYFGYTVLHYLPLGTIRPQMLIKLAETDGEGFNPYQ